MYIYIAYVSHVYVYNYFYIVIARLKEFFRLLLYIYIYVYIYVVFFLNNVAAVQCTILDDWQIVFRRFSVRRLKCWGLEKSFMILTVDTIPALCLLNFLKFSCFLNYISEEKQHFLLFLSCTFCCFYTLLR